MKTLQNVERNENLSHYTNIVILVFGLLLTRLVPQQKALNAKAIKCIGLNPSSLRC
jgi:hypothetical protein